MKNKLTTSVLKTHMCKRCMLMLLETLNLKPTVALRCSFSFRFFSFSFFFSLLVVLFDIYVDRRANSVAFFFLLLRWLNVLLYSFFLQFLSSKKYDNRCRNNVTKFRFFNFVMKTFCVWLEKSQWYMYTV